MNKKEIINLIKTYLTNEEIDELCNQLKNIKIKEEKVIKTFTKDEKINLFKSYFKGREDVYPYLSIDKKTGKKYYIPSCINEWKDGICNKKMGKKCKDCKRRENKPLTYDVYENHLKGSTIGIYPILPDNTCYFLAFDFDDKESQKDIKEDVLVFSKVCNDYNVPISIERSMSGKGYHIWIFFKTNIKAVTARKLGSLLLSKAMEKSESIKIDSFDRMFPSQDILPKDGYGNLIVLPFQKEPASYKNTLFVDEYFMAYENQWDYLYNVKKLSEIEVHDLIKILSNNTIDISHEDLDIKEEIKNKNKNNFKFPEKISVILDDMIYIDKKNLDAGVKNCFKRLASFANPEFYKKQKMRMPVYNIPMVIDCSEIDNKYIKLPRGTYEYLIDICNENNIKLNIKDKRNKGNKIDLKFNGALRRDQEEALKNLKKHDNGILYAPTGFGKTVIACKLIESRKVNTLIIVNNLTLLRQWKDKIKEFLNIEAGEIGGGKSNITNVIDIASIQTLWNKGNINEITKNYGMIIIDECHHLAAFTYEKAVNSVNSKYVYGVTATPHREDGHSPIIKMQCGDIRYEVNFKKFNKELGFSMEVLVKENYLNFVDKRITDYSLNEIKSLISKDVIRSEKIIKEVEKEFKKGKNILVITERIEHLDYLTEKISKITNNLLVYKGGLGKKVLKEYEKIKQEILDNNQNKIILATGSSIGEGFDDSSLDVLFLTMPISSFTKVAQYVGRLHRKNVSKDGILIYDYVDINFNQTRNMFEKRRKTYEKLGYEIIKEIVKR